MQIVQTAEQFIEDHIELGTNYDFPIIKKIIYCEKCELSAKPNLQIKKNT